MKKKNLEEKLQIELEEQPQTGQQILAGQDQVDDLAQQEDEEDKDQLQNQHETVKQYVIFQLETQEYGIDIMQVHEINRLKEIVISPVPKAPDYVEGIINLRGEVVPVIDLRKKLGLLPKEIDKSSRILIVKIEKKMIGLLVDGVSEVVDILESHINLPPEEVTDVSTKYLTGVAKLERRIILLLNIDEILTVEERSNTDKSIQG